MTRARVLVVAQAFKGTLAAKDVGEAIARGVRRAGAEPDVLVGSDGGDGLLDSLSSQFVRVTHESVRGPLNAPLTAPIGWLDTSTAVIESRVVCGLTLVPEARRNPLHTMTDGVGEAVRRVGDQGARLVYVGLGGSATMDGGVGFGRLLGWHMTTDSGTDVAGRGGAALADLRAVQPPPPLAVRVVGLCDVSNPLLGEHGARVYARQKGASAEVEARLAKDLEHLVDVAGGDARALAATRGAGAAGGLGFGILFFARGRLELGAPWVLDRVRFEEKLEAVDALLVAEAAFDATSLSGKLPGLVLERARERGLSTILLTPSARAVPPGVEVETGGGRWGFDDLAEHARHAVERAFT